MLIIGELINASRKQVGEAIRRRDEAVIRDLAVRQAEAGADCIDVNAGTLVGEEADALAWLVRAVQSATDRPCCVDTTDPAAARAALSVHRGRAVLNSVTLEGQRFAALAPLAKEFGSGIVALCMDEAGIPAGAARRVGLGARLVEGLGAAGIPPADVYLDPLVQPISTGADNGRVVLETIRELKARAPAAHVVCGLSNVSYGLPNRHLLNTTFLVMALAAGLDAAILDPLDRRQMAQLIAARSLLGQDRFCRSYLTAHRQGRLGDGGAV